MITVVRATAKGKFSIANIKKQTSYKWHSLLFLLSVKWEINIFKDINSTTVLWCDFSSWWTQWGDLPYLLPYWVSVSDYPKVCTWKKYIIYMYKQYIEFVLQFKDRSFFLMIYIVFVEVYFKSFLTCALFLCFSISVPELHNF